MKIASALLVLLLLLQPGFAETGYQVACGEFVLAAAQGSSPRWQLTGNLRAVHRDTPRPRNRFILIDGCMGVLLNPAVYRRIFIDRFEPESEQ
jgi:hypothetical protein